MANLLTNALTASPPGRAVRLDGDRLHLRVIDHRAGPPVDDRNRLFGPFQRLDDHGGTGLGSPSRCFTEAVDGTLTPSNMPGGGLTMTISIPVAS